MLSEIDAIRSAASGGSQPSQIEPTRTPQDRTQIFELLARTLTRIAGGRPLLLLLEDLHGAEVSIEALQYIVRRLGPTPTMIVGTYRSTETGRRHPLVRMLDGFRGDRRFSSIELRPFSPGRTSPVRGHARRRKPGRRFTGPRSLRGQRGKPVLHQGAAALAAGLGRHHAERRGRLDSVGRTGHLVRRVASDDSPGGRDAHRPPAGRPTRGPLHRGRHGQVVRVP